MGKRVIGNVCYKQSVYYKNYEYFSQYCGNGLCRRRIGDNQAELISIFPDEKQDEIDLFSAVHLYNDKLYFVPSKARHIGVFDLLDNSISVAVIEKNFENLKYYDERHKFESSYLIDNYLYMIGCTYPGIVKVNLDSMEMETINIDIKGDFGKGYFYKGGIYNGYIWCPCMSMPIILKVNLSDDTLSKKCIKTSVSGFSSIAFDNDYAYLTGRGENPNAIVKYSLVDDISKDILCDEQKEAANPFGEILKCGNRLFAFPEAGSNIYTINADDQITILEEAKSILGAENTFTIGCRLIGTSLEFFTTRDQRHHIYDLMNGVLSSESIDLLADDDVRVRQLSALIKDKPIILEGEYTIGDFISSITSD